MYYMFKYFGVFVCYLQRYVENKMGLKWELEILDEIITLNQCCTNKHNNKFAIVCITSIKLYI